MKKHKGFTLLELMIATAILSLISTAIYFFLSDSQKKANMLVARNLVKQEANKVFTILENDLTQALKGTYKEEYSEDIASFSFMVRRDEKHDAIISYKYVRPKLLRYFDGKPVPKLILNVVDEFEISNAIDNTPGKKVVTLITRSNLLGIRDDEQPTYEQQKIVVMMEDASDEYDPHWREVGDVDKFFKTQGNLIAGLKEDATQLIENFADTWSQAIGDIKKMTVGELQKLSLDLNKNLDDVKKNLENIDKEISDLDWHALYDESGLIGKIFGANKRKRKKANKVKEIVSGYKSLEEMNWNEVKSAGKGMKEDAIKAMYDAKVQLFEGRAKIKENIKAVEDQLASVK